MISVIKEWFYLYHTDFFHKFHAISVKFVKNCRKCDIKCRISCNLRAFLPNRKYRKYRVIIVSKPKISCNIVWTLKKDIVKGWLRLKNSRFAVASSALEESASRTRGTARTCEISKTCRFHNCMLIVRPGTHGPTLCVQEETQERLHVAAPARSKKK